MTDGHERDVDARTADHERWLTETLGEGASKTLRDFLYDTVIVGDWWLDRVTDWSFTVMRSDCQNGPSASR